MIQITLAISYVAISIYLHYRTYKLYRKEQRKNERIVLYVDKQIRRYSGVASRKAKALRDIKRKINEIRL